LGHVQSLLELSTVQEAKLELSDVEPVIHFERMNGLGELRRVHHQIVGVGGVHHWVVVWLAHSTVHEVLLRHSHELVLRG
jgi:tRNA A37 threonylcarbamoyladenosine dehydratase